MLRDSWLFDFPVPVHQQDSRQQVRHYRTARNPQVIEQLEVPFALFTACRRGCACTEMWRHQRRMHQIVRTPLPVVGAIAAGRLRQRKHEYRPQDRDFIWQCAKCMDAAISN
jgi:hypothetical protein